VKGVTGWRAARAGRDPVAAAAVVKALLVTVHAAEWTSQLKEIRGRRHECFCEE
jgi:hypothetical protein